MKKHCQEYVVGFMFSVDRNSVLLIEKLKPEWQKGLYNGVGGKIEFGESADAAMIREFEEEAGVAYAPWIPFIVVSDPESQWKVYFYKAFSERVFDTKSMTKEKLCLFAPSSLPLNSISNLSWLIPMALDDNIRTDVISNRGR